MNNNLNDQFLSKKKNQYFLKHIATIFIRLELNFNDKLNNATSFPLAIDCLTDESRFVLFKIVASTVEEKLVNLLEVYRLDAISSEEAMNILEDILLTSSNKFIRSYLKDTCSSESLLDFGLDFSLCDLVVWNYILNYLCTGNVYVLQKKQFLNLSKELLEEHLLALLDHFVIKLANILIDSILNSDDVLMYRDCVYFICDSNYLAQRSLINLKNNLLLLKGLDFYIYNPKLVYENKYCLFIVDSASIVRKKIYSYRQREISILSRPQLLVLLLLEIQDLILPKLKNFVYLLGKSVIYLFSYILGAAIRIMTRKPF